MQPLRLSDGVNAAPSAHRFDLRSRELWLPVGLGGTSVTQYPVRGGTDHTPHAI